MPTDRDIDKIEKMIEEVGDVEKKLGIIDESYLAKGKSEEQEESEDFNKLLEDIEVGLKEEKELESQISKRSEEEEHVSEELPAEGLLEKSKEEELPSEKEKVEIELKEEGPEAEEFSIEELEVPEIKESDKKEKKEEIEKTPKKEEAVKIAEKEPAAEEIVEEIETVEETEREKGGIEERISEEELQEEISRLEGVEEEGEGEPILDLPEDFDIDKLTTKEEPPKGFFKPEKKEKIEEKRESEVPEEALTRELEGIIEGIEEKGEKEPSGVLEGEEGKAGEFEFLEEELPEEGVGKGAEKEEIIEEEFPEGEIPSIESLEEEKEIEKIEKPEELGEAEAKEEGILGEELPEIEEIISEEEPIEKPPETIEKIEPAEAERAFEEKAGPEAKEAEESFDLELSDEDIVLIITKLKQLTPELALAIRDSILASEIPLDKVKGLIELLISDAPEEEIKNYFELVTGKKIIIEKVPEVIKVEKKRGPLAAVYENLAPMARVTALGIIAVAIILSIFMLFFYRPIKANRYYTEGISYLKSENYRLAEEYFKKGQSIYSKVEEYDRYGWEYMLAGNYDKAMGKFIEGINKDKRFRVVSLRLHLAKLYNILGQYKKADELYTKVVSRYPREYEYIKLKGLNLIDWGKINKEQLKRAYALFSEANKSFPKESDPVIRMLYISVLLDKIKNVKSLYDYLNQNYPNSLDSLVHTKLANYFVQKGEFTLAKSLLMKLLAKFPDYPPLYYAYARYYKAIGSKKDQEIMLNIAISKEESRKILYPWDSHDRSLLSNAYNDLGELYASLEIPGKSAEAIRYFKKAIEENPENTKAYFNIAQVYFYKEMDYELAERYYTEAKKRGFENNDLIYNLGVLYFYKKDFSRAVNNWVALNERMPGNPNVSFSLACAFLHMKKYEAALGELLNLSETYNRLIKELGEIKPWKAYHKMILQNAASVYNNLGVAYEKLFEKTKNIDYQRKSLISLYKAGEFADIIGVDRGPIQYNINYILHPNVIRADMAISDSISTNYRFIHQ